MLKNNGHAKVEKNSSVLNLRFASRFYSFLSLSLSLSCIPLKAGEGSGAAAKSKDPLVQAATRTLASAGGGSSNANAIRARFEGPVRHACLQVLTSEDNIH